MKIEMSNIHLNLNEMCCVYCGSCGEFIFENENRPVYSYLKHHDPPVMPFYEPEGRDLIGGIAMPGKLICMSCSNLVFRVGQRKFVPIKEVMNFDGK